MSFTGVQEAPVSSNPDALWQLVWMIRAYAVQEEQGLIADTGDGTLAPQSNHSPPLLHEDLAQVISISLRNANNKPRVPQGNREGP